MIRIGIEIQQNIVVTIVLDPFVPEKAEGFIRANSLMLYFEWTLVIKSLDSWISFILELLRLNLYTDIILLIVQPQLSVRESREPHS